MFKEFDEELNVSKAIQYAEEHFQDFLQARKNPYKVVVSGNTNAQEGNA